jgi:hypothetical protein
MLCIIGVEVDNTIGVTVAFKPCQDSFNVHADLGTISIQILCLRNLRALFP